MGRQLLFPLFGGGAAVIRSLTGYIEGFVVKYNSTTAITVEAGIIEANNKIYNLASDAIHNMTSLAAAIDIHYIYIDDDASSPPTPTIIDSTVEPAWSDAKRGWYNGDDRCIGAVRSPAASATLEYFSVKIIGGKNIEHTIGRKDQLATNMDPSGAWQIPNTQNTSGVIPVNAVSVNINLNGGDVGAGVGIYATNAEMAAVNISVFQGCFEQFQYYWNGLVTGFFPLGASRDIRIAGENDDDNTLSAWLFGYGFSR